MLALLIAHARAVLYAGAAAATVLVGAMLLHQHDNHIRAALQAAQDRAIAAAQVDSERRVNAALSALQTAQAQRDAAMAATRRTINAAPVTTACSRAPALRAALDSLRPHSNAGAPAGRP